MFIDDLYHEQRIVKAGVFPADVLAGRPFQKKKLCRTFSDCTTAPRNGLVSGCYPLDPAYKTHPDRPQLVIAKRRARNAGVSAKKADR